jgi:hypothetical protein
MIYIQMRPDGFYRSMKKKPRQGATGASTERRLGGSDRHSVFGFDGSPPSVSSVDTVNIFENGTHRLFTEPPE